LLSIANPFLKHEERDQKAITKKEIERLEG
jgi:acyl-CoA thioesterase